MNKINRFFKEKSHKISKKVAVKHIFFFVK